jgi:hypothetical protein
MTHPHYLCAVHVPKRENVIVNRLNKTKVERVVDHEAERIERVKSENAAKRAAAAAKVHSATTSQLPERTDSESD